MEQISGPPAKTGTFYQTPRSHPWRPTMGYEAVEVTPLHEQPITNQLVASSYSPSGMCSDPVTFPNLVTGFERNPQHAARAALYTRYTPNEWTTSNVCTYADADKNRNYSEKVRSEAVRLMRETDEKTSQGQRDAARRLGERITDITFWRNELTTELEKLIAESAQLTDTKRNVQKALQDLEPPLHIAQECLYHRESRKGIELVHDARNKTALAETEKPTTPTPTTTAFQLAANTLPVRPLRWVRIRSIGSALRPARHDNFPDSMDYTNCRPPGKARNRDRGNRFGSIVDLPPRVCVCVFCLGHPPPCLPVPIPGVARSLRAAGPSAATIQSSTVHRNACSW